MLKLYTKMDLLTVVVGRMHRKDGGKVETEKLPADSRVEALLESFVCEHVLPVGVRALRDLSELPIGLQGFAINAEKNNKTWGAWSDNQHVWLFAAEMSVALSRRLGYPVLQVDAYGEDGQLIESGCWLSAPDGGWRRCTV